MLLLALSLNIFMDLRNNIEAKTHFRLLECGVTLWFTVHHFFFVNTLGGRCRRGQRQASLPEPVRR